MRSLLILLLAVMSSDAMAEWVKVASDAVNAYDVYAKPDSIRRSGDKVKMWDLVDFHEYQKDGDALFLSAKSLHEYDCEELQSRVLYYVWLSKNMGIGVAVYTGSKTQEWEPVKPHSVNEDMLKYACGTK
jgi:Surface-adhesin protein E